MDFKEVFYDWHGYNAKIFYIINGIQNEALQKFMLLGSQLGYYKIFYGYIAALVIFAVAFSFKKKNKGEFAKKNYRNLWIGTLTTLTVSYILSMLWVRPLKDYFHFPRPFVALPEGSVNILDSVRSHESAMASFPSGHSSFAMMMVAGLWPILNMPGKIIAVFYLIWVGMSRISLGVHFPADVLISFIISFCTVYIASSIVNIFYTKVMNNYKR